uniref:SNase domain containing protein n=1 Tax=Echinococcus granulosus TaxID=6210 RepID=A0A068WHM3_ECHGR|nr:SNase domain containing protein [Echinococcus granulosus]
MARPPIFCGFGKLVLSGDTIVIRDRAQDGPPSARTVILSNISCPKVAKRLNPSGEPTSDEPFGWIAREFVRSKVVGKEVCYTVENQIGSDRVYGSVFLGRDSGAQNLTHLLVSEGLAQVRRNVSQAMIEKSPTLQALIGLEEKARADRKGFWSGSEVGAPRNICWNILDPTNFFNLHVGKPLHGVVEFVREGNTMQIQLFPVDEDVTPTYYNITVLLSGIKTPGSKVVEGSRVYDPFALDAQFFVESRLLQRDVTVILESMSNSLFVGSVLHPNGNIALFLLREGLARCLEWNLAVVSLEAGGAEAYRSAEQKAKQKSLRIWEDYVPPAGEFADASEGAAKTEKKAPYMQADYTGVVVEVGNGDNVLVRCQDSIVRKFFLSSVRPPREVPEMSRPQQTVPRPLYQVPYLYEAREFLRKRLIGKQVRVQIDYVQLKPQGSTLADRVCATILVGENNIAEALVQRGLGSVVRYRNATDSRSRHYDALRAAEAAAQKKGVGIFDPKDVPVHRLSELGGKFFASLHCNVAKSRQFLYSLQRAGAVDALVEFVASASRLRVEIHRENLLCAILAAGVICPRPSRKLPNQPEEASEPFGDEAREYTHDLVMQREVKFEVDGMDRLGNLIGWITLPSEVRVTATGARKGKKGGPFISSKDLSAVLVARGYATVNRAPNVQRSSHFASLLRAESFAQEHNLGLWSSPEFRASWNADVNVVEGDGQDCSDASKSMNGLLFVRDLQNAHPDAEIIRKSTSDRLKSANLAQVTTISNPAAGNNGFRFFVHLNSRTALVNTINRELNSPNFPSVESSTDFQPKRGMVCAARFSIDNLWYRARILRVIQKIVTVLFIDFGNEEAIDTSVGSAPRLAALPRNLASQDPLATEYRLAYVQLPPDPDDREAALDYLAREIGDQDIRVSPVPGPPTPCGKDDNRPIQSAVVYVTRKQVAESSSSTQSTPEFVDVGEQLLRDGLAYMENVRMPPDICVHYSEAQKAAMGTRANIWRYGDFRDDDMD